MAIAAHQLEAAPEDIELADSRAFVRGTPVGQHLAERVGPDGVLRHRTHCRRVSRPGSRPAGGTPPDTVHLGQRHPHLHAARSTSSTGQVTLLRYIVSEDCGPMINPNIVEGQIAGGTVQGIGGVLYEHLAYDDDGNPLATTFMDYLLPTAAEVPVIEYGHVETPEPRTGRLQGSRRRRRHRRPARRRQRGGRRALALRRDHHRLPSIAGQDL